MNGSALIYSSLDHFDQQQTLASLVLWEIASWKKKKNKPKPKRCPTSFIAESPFYNSVEQQQLPLSERGLNCRTPSSGQWGTKVTLESEFSGELRVLDMRQEGKGCCRGSSVHSFSPLHIQFLKMIQLHETAWQLPI